NDPPAFDVTRTAFSAPGPDGKPIYADARLLGEMLRRTALSVQPEGWVKAHTASDRYDIHAKMEDRACDWVQGARRYHESTGDLALIREIWPVIVRQMDYFLERRSARGLVIGREWVIWGNPLGYQTSEGAGLNAFVYKALVDAAYLGNALGHKDPAARFAQAAKDLSSAYNRLLWDEEHGTYYSGYETPKEELPPGVDNENQKFPSDWRMPPKPAMLENRLLASSVYPALFALDQEIVPPERRARVTRYLLAQPDPKPRIMFNYYYWKQLYAANEPARDRFILDTMRQKWKTMAESPWQTTWEEFGEGSKAHCYGMFPGYFLSAYVLGVRPELPISRKRLLIEPHLGDLTSAEGIVVTEHGPVPVSWKIENGSIRFHIEIPAGVTTTLRVPKPGAGGKLILAGKPVASRDHGRFLETELGAGVHDGRIEQSH
ncbi:MAG: alpha-L-rhamnosidase C-terminal domain-containing protein, partial [Luteolibacter sp.]